MALSNDIKMPTDEELTVPQEITLSTPYFKAAAPYMHRACEDEIREFMLRRTELEDPRKTLELGKLVTNCGVKFLQSVKRTCADEFKAYGQCIDQGSSKLYVSKCREEQRFFDRCVEDNLKIKRPPMGYFSKIHVHESAAPKPEPVIRDYKAEAEKVLRKLPDDYHFRKDYRRFQDWKTNFVEN
ncbi:hypothetical protein L596_025489 [Steinernema carpocapsae]|uniref:IMS import disulfide relay-system CHCH-CHCH-like Cx9C domain-containing protein n=1 Tax=Steinernema carpocapsae TaxID=34508 RepID=A0A4V5ZYU1_STECR|nr:hypothetical protein L596_025489 [Steinernema carpocapsae]